MPNQEPYRSSEEAGKAQLEERRRETLGFVAPKFRQMSTLLWILSVAVSILGVAQISPLLNRWMGYDSPVQSRDSALEPPAVAIVIHESCTVVIQQPETMCTDNYVLRQPLLDLWSPIVDWNLATPFNLDAFPHLLSYGLLCTREEILIEQISLSYAPPALTDASP